MLPEYDPQTLAIDALAVAGIICEPVAPDGFDPVRELLAQYHADLVDDLSADDVQTAAARISRQLPQTLAAVAADIQADQADLDR